MKLCIRTQDDKVETVKKALKDIYGDGFVEFDPEWNPITFWVTIKSLVAADHNFNLLAKYITDQIPEIVDIVEARTDLL